MTKSLLFGAAVGVRVHYVCSLQMESSKISVPSQLSAPPPDPYLAESYYNSLATSFGLGDFSLWRQREANNNLRDSVPIVSSPDYVGGDIDKPWAQDTWDSLFSEGSFQERDTLQECDAWIKGKNHARNLVCVSVSEYDAASTIPGEVPYHKWKNWSYPNIQTWMINYNSNWQIQIFKVFSIIWKIKIIIFNVNSESWCINVSKDSTYWKLNFSVVDYAGVEAQYTGIDATHIDTMRNIFRSDPAKDGFSGGIVNVLNSCTSLVGRTCGSSNDLDSWLNILNTSIKNSEKTETQEDDNVVDEV